MGRGPVCLSVLSPPAEWPDSTACGCAPQQPGDCQTAASQGELPTQLSLGKSGLGFPGDVGMWCVSSACQSGASTAPQPWHSGNV